MLASFIILYHPIRIENLEQTIRFLQKREKKLLDQEFIFVCQTNYNLKNYFTNQVNLNLNLKNYHKSLMTNRAAELSKGDLLILLDSDRILPENYFYNSINISNENTVVSTKNLYQLDKPYTDNEIELNQIKKTPDFRKKLPEGRFKNLFAGNTIISKKAYNSMQGYDESFVGYGFADNDMTQKAINCNLEIIWLCFEELHLFHEKYILWNEEIISKDVFKITTAINALLFYKKWKIKINSNVKSLINEINNNIDKFPIELQHKYKINKSYFFKAL